MESQESADSKGSYDAADGPAVSVRNLGKCYRIYRAPRDKLKEVLLFGRRVYHREFWALKDISLEIGKGETVGIIGGNGSGKSTLLQVVCGTTWPTTGSVDVWGRVAGLLELGSGFSPDFTGRENVYMNAAILGLSREEIDERYDSIAQFADIGAFTDQPVRFYSSGMYVRLAFSVAISVAPDILVIDEALAVGDMAFQAKCFDKLDELRRARTTILLVSHDMTAIKRLCDRVVYIRNGMLRAQGNPNDVVEQYYYDTRSDQAMSQSSQVRVERRKPIGPAGAIAFGTNQGSILSATFVQSGLDRSSFVMGERIEVRVETRYANTLNNPCLSLIVHDRHGIEIGGRYFSLSPISEENGWCRSSVILAFDACLLPGAYAVTLRLEERQSESVFFPIDKQVSALLFEIAPTGDNASLGMVDLHIEEVER
jgi:lipopolysaccharide transport system ATP-binding protein